MDFATNHSSVASCAKMSQQRVGDLPTTGINCCLKVKYNITEDYTTDTQADIQGKYPNQIGSCSQAAAAPASTTPALAPNSLATFTAISREVEFKTGDNADW